MKKIGGKDQDYHQTQKHSVTVLSPAKITKIRIIIILRIKDTDIGETKIWENKDTCIVQCYCSPPNKWRLQWNRAPFLCECLKYTKVQSLVSMSVPVPVPVRTCTVQCTTTSEKNLTIPTNHLILHGFITKTHLICIYYYNHVENY